MDDDRQAFEFAYALYLARQVDREAAQMIVAAAEAGWNDERIQGTEPALTTTSELRYGRWLKLSYQRLSQDVTRLPGSLTPWTVSG